LFLDLAGNGDGDFIPVRYQLQATTNWNGQLDLDTGHMTLTGSVRILMTSLDEFAGVLTNCPIGPFDPNLDSDNGFEYSEFDGNADLYDDDAASNY
jgi:hypothetical protein